MFRYQNMKQCTVICCNLSNWKFGILYYCPDDPRVIVRQLLPVGWTWNFGHTFVIPAIVLAVLFFFTPISLAYYLGIRSKLIYFVTMLFTLVLLILIANRLARDPDKERRL